MKYCIAKHNKLQEELLYKTYVTDTLQIISTNCINVKNAKAIKDRFISIARPIKADKNAPTEEEVRTSIDAILAKLRGKEEKY